MLWGGTQCPSPCLWAQEYMAATESLPTATFQTPCSSLQHFLSFHWCVFVSSKFVLICALSFCPSPASQHPGVVLPLYGIQMHGKLSVKTTTLCLGHGTPPSLSSFFVTCQIKFVSLSALIPFFLPHAPPAILLLSQDSAVSFH